MRFVLVFAVALGLSACSITKTDFPIDAEGKVEVEELGLNVQIEKITTSNIASLSAANSKGGGATNLPSAGEWNYRVGVGDLLDITVWDHPELTMPNGPQRSAVESGLRVQADGTFFYPFVGQVQARGLAPEKIRQNLTEQLSKFIPDPQIDVRVISYSSQAVSVTGEVQTPNRQNLSSAPLTLLEAIDAAGGAKESADTSAIRIRRGGKSYTVNLRGFLESGIAKNNPTLLAGDVINVPRIRRQEAYMLGKVGNVQRIDLAVEDITLTQAITDSGGLNEDFADARGIFVFRDTKDGIKVYQLDASNPVAFLLGTKFVLRSNDVVYVTTAPVSKWNKLISSLLPTVTAYRTANSL